MDIKDMTPETFEIEHNFKWPEVPQVKDVPSFVKRKRFMNHTVYITYFCLFRPHKQKASHRKSSWRVVHNLPKRKARRVVGRLGR